MKFTIVSVRSMLPKFGVDGFTGSRPDDNDDDDDDDDDDDEHIHFRTRFYKLQSHKTHTVYIWQT